MPECATEETPQIFLSKLPKCLNLGQSLPEGKGEAPVPLAQRSWQGAKVPEVPIKANCLICFLGGLGFGLIHGLNFVVGDGVSHLKT